MDVEGEERPLKLYFIPYLASGHMIPLCDIAILFAAGGQDVTIITTPSNSRALQTSILHPSLPNLRLHTVPFPSRQLGLPDGVESFSAVTDLQTTFRVHQGIKLLRDPVQHFIQHNPPDCIVADYCFPWMDDLADELHIRRLSFNPSPLFALCAMRAPGSASADGSSSFVLRGLPHHRDIALNAAPPESLTACVEPLLKKELRSSGVIINSFAELEGEEYIEHYERITGGHKAWLLGPAFLVGRERRGPEKSTDSSGFFELELLSWLDSKKPESVLYVCFGSMWRFSDEQLYEMASGIEASGAEFVWVVPEKKGKEGESEEEKAKWMPKGFEEKGMILRGWAPQRLILSHRSVGAFLTHCGSNSALEAVSAGVPMITWPVLGDQFYTEKLMTEVRGVGVEVGAEEWSMGGGGGSERRVVITTDKIEKAVRRLMDGGEEANRIRRRVRELGKLANEAVQPGGSSHRISIALIAHLKTLRDTNRRKMSKNEMEEKIECE